MPKKRYLLPPARSGRLRPFFETPTLPPPERLRRAALKDHRRALRGPPFQSPSSDRRFFGSWDFARSPYRFVQRWQWFKAEEVSYGLSPLRPSMQARRVMDDPNAPF